MRYISDDGKVFDTKQECWQHEKLLESEKAKKEKLEIERRNKLDAINKKYDELQKLVSEYEKDYGVVQKPYFAPIYELLDMLCR